MVCSILERATLHGAIKRIIEMTALRLESGAVQDFRVDVRGVVGEVPVGQFLQGHVHPLQRDRTGFLLEVLQKKPSYANPFIIINLDLLHLYGYCLTQIKKRLNTE